MAHSIRYVVGDATRPVDDGFKIIAHVCNDVGKWGAGFVLAVSKRWRAPEQRYREWFNADHPSLGAVQFVDVAPGIAVANMIGQHGIRRQNGAAPIRYDAVRECLSKVRVYASEHAGSVHMPRIGCGLAGGTWDEIEPLIAESLSAHDVPVYVYDLQR